VKVRKAVIPAAGLGTRMLPATKSQPKEMLTIVDKPVIQYVVEDAVRSGIKDILIVIGKGKDAIKHHFDKDFENSYYLEKKGKLKELEELRRISSLANIHFTLQKELLGDTILEPKSKKPVLAQLIDVFDNHGSSVIALEEVPTDLVSRYGIMGGKQIENSTLYEVAQWIEKPHKDQAPSNLAIAGRYLFTPEIFKMLDKTTPGLNNEVQLTDAMRSLLLEQKMYGLRFEGKRYDIGNKLDFIKTNLLFGLHDKILGEDLRIWLENHKEL
jgi:UTP--glucose-1-phosphate uridylyltransferase